MARLMTVEDWVVEELAADEAAALERVQALEAENAVLWTMVSEALTLLSRTTAHLDTARQTIHALRAVERRGVKALRPAA